MARITTLEEVLEWVQSVGMCTLFSGKAKGVPSLWDATDLPTKGGGRTGWGARVEAIWAWKNELPTVYPDLIYYGKMPGGHAALISMQFLREQHYPRHHMPVADCSWLAGRIFEIIRLSPGETAEIRREAMSLHGCSKSQFESALKQLQVALNIARTNEPDAKKDAWLPFLELYPEFDDK